MSFNIEKERALFEAYASDEITGIAAKCPMWTESDGGNYLGILTSAAWTTWKHARTLPPTDITLDEHALEKAFWQFEAAHKEQDAYDYAGHTMSEYDAFKAAVFGLINNHN